MSTSDARVTLSAQRPVRAGEPNTLTFTLRCGRRAIGRGGGLEIVFRSDKPEVSWTVPQSGDPTAPGYVAARAPAGVELRWAVSPMPPFAERFSFRFHVVSCYVTSGRLSPGQELTVTYGDTEGGSYGALAPVVAISSRFPVLIYDGARRRVSEFYSRQYRAMGARALECYQDSDALLIVQPGAGRPSHLFAVVPSAAVAGRSVELKAVALDRYANLTEHDSDAVDVLLLDAERRIRQHPSALVLRRGKGSTRLRAPGPGVYYLRLEDRRSGLWGVSNPFLVSRRPRHRLFWGDPHCHSLLSDGATSSEEHYRYARDVALLDFAAVTDHGPGSTEIWQETCRWADSFNRPGRFVTLLGHERAFQDGEGGSSHVNYYYLTGDSLAQVPEPVSGPRSPELLQRLRKLKGIVVPHHTAYAIDSMGLSDWSLFDGLPLVTCEVYSTHGNSESYDGPRPVIARRPGIYYQDALARGLRLGAIAGSDHHGVPCGSLLKLQEFPKNSTDEHMALRGGLTAARAHRLTRKALFDALVARQTYASTGDRILLDFRVSGHEMGSVVTTARRGPRRVSFLVAGTALVERVEVLKNNDVLAAFEPGQFVFRRTVTDREAGRCDREWYYLRVLQADGEMAWSSPVWFVRGG